MIEKRDSVQLSRWDGKVDAKTLAAMQAFVPKGMTLKGNIHRWRARTFLLHA